MLKRKAYLDLLKWKEKRRKEALKKCLLIKGARQVGKSFIVEEFGKNEYESFIKIDFYKQKALKTIFDGDLSSVEIYKRMTANIPGIRLIPGNTLIFLDEI
ncbi:MAG: AAA family ATPase, partial [Lachnospiraceae bacterium]|nr:AAA family ATPase [Lachnospiraceae bacterium]